MCAKRCVCTDRGTRTLQVVIKTQVSLVRTEPLSGGIPPLSPALPCPACSPVAGTAAYLSLFNLKLSEHTETPLHLQPSTPCSLPAPTLSQSPAPISSPP